MFSLALLSPRGAAIAGRLLASTGYRGEGGKELQQMRPDKPRGGVLEDGTEVGTDDSNTSVSLLRLGHRGGLPDVHRIRADRHQGVIVREGQDHHALPMPG